MRIALVLAAGGSVGVAYHGAVLSALEEVTGWDPRRADLIVGTSAGSVTAAVLRAGVPASDLAHISEGSPLSPEGARLAAIGRPHRPRPRPTDLLAFRPVADPVAVLCGLSRPWQLSRGFVVAALPAGGIPTGAISDGIDAVYAGGWPAEPTWICAYDLRAGQRVVFGRAGAPETSIGRAVAASSAVPSYFRPVVIGGRRYVDGGVYSMANLDLAGEAGADLVVVVSPLSSASRYPEPSPVSLIRRPLRRQLRTEISRLRQAGPAVVAIQPGRTVAAAMGFNPMDAARRHVVSRTARQGVRRWLLEGHEGRRLAELLRREAARHSPLAAPVVSGTGSLLADGS